jgi:hypothetical protein
MTMSQHKKAKKSETFSAEKQENAFSPNKQAVNFKRFHLFI